MVWADIPLPSARQHARPLLVMGVPDWDRRLAEDGSALAHVLQQWITQAQWRLLALHKGRILRRLANGLAMEFADARSCLQATFALGELAGAMDPGLPTCLRFCAGAHLADSPPGEDGVQGRDVDLASGLAALAQPGELLVTAALRHQLAEGVDADFEDLGYLRVRLHARPERVFRAHPGPENASDWQAIADRDLRPGLAVIPFHAGVAQAKHRVLGELIADGVIARLSHSIGLRVISRQSTNALRGNKLGEIERHLGAAFVLSGSYGIRGKMLVVDAELAEVRSHTVLWSGRLQHPMGDLLHPDSQLLYGLAHAAAQALGRAQVRKPVAQPLPHLDRSLLLASFSMPHDQSTRSFERTRKMLTGLIARHPQLALPRAWLGMLHSLKVVTGQSKEADNDARLAREQLSRALESEPGNALALAVSGYVQCQLLSRPDRARKFLDAALEANPSEPLAWLFRSLYSCMWKPGTAVTEVHIACSLSPADPVRFFFDMFMANALFAHGQYEKAIASAQRSLRANRHHVPTLRVLLSAQVECGRLSDGRETLNKLRAELPGLTVASYLRTGSADSPTRQRMARAMRQLGLPER